MVLGPSDVQQTQTQHQQPADITERPTVTGNTSHVVLTRDLGQKRRDKILAAGEHHARENDEHQGRADIARAGKTERRGKADATDGGNEQKAFFPGAMIGDGADHRRAREHEKVGDAHGQRPEQRRGTVVGAVGACHHADEIGAVDRRQHHGGVTRVGEVVHRPRENFAPRSGRGGSDRDVRGRRGVHNPVTASLPARGYGARIRAGTESADGGEFVLGGDEFVYHAQHFGAVEIIHAVIHFLAALLAGHQLRLT